METIVAPLRNRCRKKKVFKHGTPEPRTGSLQSSCERSYEALENRLRDEGLGFRVYRAPLRDL